MELKREISVQFLKDVLDNKTARLIIGVVILIIVIGIVLLYISTSGQQDTTVPTVSPKETVLKDNNGNVLPVKLEKHKSVEDTSRFTSRDIFQSLISTSSPAVSPTQSGDNTVTGGTDKEPQPDQYTPVVTISSPQDNSTVSASITIKATIDDTGKGSSRIASAYYSVGGGSAVSMAAADGKFDSSTEEVTADLDTTNFANGNYELQVLGRDAVGNQGVGTITIRIVNPSLNSWMRNEELSNEYAMIKFATADESSLKTYKLQPGDKFENNYMLVSIAEDYMVVWKGDERIELKQGEIYYLE